MSFDPPTSANWVYTHPLDEEYPLAYIAGYQAALDGLSLEMNPHKESGHERETTFTDELHFWWYSGWSSYP